VIRHRAENAHGCICVLWDVVGFLLVRSGFTALCFLVRGLVRLAVWFVAAGVDRCVGKLRTLFYWGIWACIYRASVSFWMLDVSDQTSTFKYKHHYILLELKSKPFNIQYSTTYRNNTPTMSSPQYQSVYIPNLHGLQMLQVEHSDYEEEVEVEEEIEYSSYNSNTSSSASSIYSASTPATPKRRSFASIPEDAF
jgi:hypothetical protein